MRLFTTARAPIESAEAEVAVGDEGPHPELLGERERVTVVAVRVLRGIAAGGDLAEEAEGPRFVGALTALASKDLSSPCDFERILEPAEQETGATQRMVRPAAMADESPGLWSSRSIPVCAT